MFTIAVHAHQQVWPPLRVFVNIVPVSSSPEAAAAAAAAAQVEQAH